MEEGEQQRRVDRDHAGERAAAVASVDVRAIGHAPSTRRPRLALRSRNVACAKPDLARLFLHPAAARDHGGLAAAAKRRQVPPFGSPYPLQLGSAALAAAAPNVA